jgi:hypothetical protein
VASHIQSRTVPPEGPSRAHPPAPPPPPARRPVLPQPPPERVISLLPPPPPSEARKPPPPPPERVISLLPPPPPSEARKPPPPPPERVISLLPPPPSEAGRILPPAPPPAPAITHVPSPPDARVISPLPPPPPRGPVLRLEPPPPPPRGPVLRLEPPSPPPRPPLGLRSPAHEPTETTPLRSPAPSPPQNFTRSRGRHALGQSKRRADLGFRRPEIVYASLAGAALLLLGLWAGSELVARNNGTATIADIRALEQRLSDRIGETLAAIEERLAPIEGGSEGSPSAGDTLDPEPGPTAGSLTLDGSGSVSTSAFSRRGTWTVEWEGEDVFIFVNRAGEGGLVRGDGGRGKGSFVVPESGRFVMDVLARGDWVIRILDS